MFALWAIFWLLSVAGSVIAGTKYRDIADAIKKLHAEHEPAPAEVVISSPKKYSQQPKDGTVVVTTKTPRQIQHEAEEEADRKAGLL